MKRILPIVGLILTTTATSFSQEDKFSQDFQPVRAELTKWDPIRGEWLASSLVAMADKRPVPDRTFPENLTPVDMLRLVPEENRTRINQLVRENQRVATETSSREDWNTIYSIVNRPSCKPIMARSSGDPHMSSFDGGSYDIQTVGEFVLVKSVSENIEIQTRQQPQTDDFSLNTAVAMNVAGDRVCIYANEKPDNASNCALRINGSPVYITADSYFLPHGGIVSYSTNRYIVTWPTGETANVDMKNTSRMNFLNIAVQIYPCAQNDLQGLLGNANGNSNDDFDRNGARGSNQSFPIFGNDQVSNTIEKEHLAFLARDFSRSYRITQSTSLFDYGFGQSTMAYTDESFPRVHRTISDLPNDRQVSARRNCENQGITGNDLYGCIYDNAYLEIPPSPRPVINDPTSGVTIGRLEKPVRNINPGPDGKKEVYPVNKESYGSNAPSKEKPVLQESVTQEPSPVKETNTVFKTESKPSNSNGTGSKPSGENTSPIKQDPVKPSTTIKSTPVPKPTPPPAPKPAPVAKPAPAPAPKPGKG